MSLRFFLMFCAWRPQHEAELAGEISALQQKMQAVHAELATLAAYADTSNLGNHDDDDVESRTDGETPASTVSRGSSKASGGTKTAKTKDSSKKEEKKHRRSSSTGGASSRRKR